MLIPLSALNVHLLKISKTFEVISVTAEEPSNVTDCIFYNDIQPYRQVYHYVIPFQQQRQNPILKGWTSHGKRHSSKNIKRSKVK